MAQPGGARSGPRGRGGSGPRRFKSGPGGGKRFQKRRTRRTLTGCDYKSVDLLKQFLTEKGKIVPRKVSRLSAKDQRELTKAVKRSRHAGLLGFLQNAHY